MQGQPIWKGNATNNPYERPRRDTFDDVKVITGATRMWWTSF